jgi:hypothetical protein
MPHDGEVDKAEQGHGDVAHDAGHGQVQDVAVDGDEMLIHCKAKLYKSRRTT